MPVLRGVVARTLASAHVTLTAPSPDRVGREKRNIVTRAMPVLRGVVAPSLPAPRKAEQCYAVICNVTSVTKLSP